MLTPKEYQMKALEEGMTDYGNLKTLQFTKDLLRELDSRGVEVSYRYSLTDKKDYRFLHYYTNPCQFYLTQDPENMLSFAVDAYMNDKSSLLFLLEPGNTSAHEIPVLVLFELEDYTGPYPVALSVKEAADWILKNA